MPELLVVGGDDAYVIGVVAQVFPRYQSTMPFVPCLLKTKLLSGDCFFWRDNLPEWLARVGEEAHYSEVDFPIELRRHLVISRRDFTSGAGFIGLVGWIAVGAVISAICKPLPKLK